MLETNHKNKRTDFPNEKGTYGLRCASEDLEIGSVDVGIVIHAADENVHFGSVLNVGTRFL